MKKNQVFAAVILSSPSLCKTVYVRAFPSAVVLTLEFGMDVEAGLASPFQQDTEFTQCFVSSM